MSTRGCKPQCVVSISRLLCYSSPISDYWHCPFYYQMFSPWIDSHEWGTILYAHHTLSCSLSMLHNNPVIRLLQFYITILFKTNCSFVPIWFLLQPFCSEEDECWLPRCWYRPISFAKAPVNTFHISKHVVGLKFETRFSLLWFIDKLRFLSTLMYLHPALSALSVLVFYSVHFWSELTLSDQDSNLGLWFKSWSGREVT